MLRRHAGHGRRCDHPSDGETLTSTPPPRIKAGGSARWCCRLDQKSQNFEIPENPQLARPIGVCRWKRQARACRSCWIPASACGLAERFGGGGTGLGSPEEVGTELLGSREAEGWPSGRRRSLLLFLSLSLTLALTPFRTFSQRGLRGGLTPERFPTHSYRGLRGGLTPDFLQRVEIAG
jgi:hypothetical protein